MIISCKQSCNRHTSFRLVMFFQAICIIALFKTAPILYILALIEGGRSHRSHIIHINSTEAGVTAGAAAHATELRKHEANDAKCNDLGWICIPLVMESYGAWGKEAWETFSMLASRLATSSSRPKSIGFYLSYTAGSISIYLGQMWELFCPDFHALIRYTSEFVCCFVTCV